MVAIPARGWCIVITTVPACHVPGVLRTERADGADGAARCAWLGRDLLWPRQHGCVQPHCHRRRHRPGQRGTAFNKGAVAVKLIAYASSHVRPTARVVKVTKTRDGIAHFFFRISSAPLPPAARRSTSGSWHRPPTRHAAPRPRASEAAPARLPNTPRGCVSWCPFYSMFFP